MSESTTLDTDEVDWSTYAIQYDVMCETNSYYRDNINLLVEHLSAWHLPESPTILDLGAGTGNYIIELATRMPSASFLHVDSNSEMNARAREKYKTSLTANVLIVDDPVQQARIGDNQCDLILCIHALYAMHPQELVLSKIHNWLKPTGKFFVIDLGRQMDTADWGLHLLLKSARERSLLSYLHNTFVKGRKVLRQNSMTTKGQISGRYWTHETSEFRNTLAAAGFEVEEIGQCYRGYSDFAVCTKIR